MAPVGDAMTKKRLKKKSQDLAPSPNSYGTESIMSDLGKLLSQHWKPVLPTCGTAWLGTVSVVAE